MPQDVENPMTLSHIVGPAEGTLLETTIGEQLDLVAARFPDNEALVVRHQNLRLTYRQLHAQAVRCAQALLALDVKPGERVGVWAPNCSEWTIVQYATAKIGAILVNINPAYRLHEVEYALKQSGCSVLVTAPTFKSSDYVRMLMTLAPEIASQRHGQLKLTKLPMLRGIIVLDDAERPGVASWPVFLATAASVPADDVARVQKTLKNTDAINIQYTSGTTGFPKGATLSHRNILNNGHRVAERMNFTDRDRLVVPVPLYHCFGMVMGNLGCMAHGATAIYPSPGFDAKAVLEAIQAERATALFGVPTMFLAELEHPDFDRYDLTSLRTGVMAGSPCPVEIMKRVISRMHLPEIEIGYGMTETSPVSTQTRVDTPFEQRVGTVGVVHPHLEIKVVDPSTGQTLPLGQPGEFCTRGYSVMLGYWQDKAATERAIDKDGWMHSGDLATFDKDGYVNIVGRIKDMIIRGGENIAPREIEEFLLTHPAICDASVIGVPDAKFGEEVMVWVRLNPNATLTADELRDYCKGRIAHYKVPRYVKFVREFPMTVTGKIQKFAMREQSIAELALEGAASIKTA
jgi:fatty-acyl-CoA synthase